MIESHEDPNSAFPWSISQDATAGFGWVAWRHGIGLGIDAQAVFALIWIPIWSLAPIAVGCSIAQVMQRHLHRKGRS